MLSDLIIDFFEAKGRSYTELTIKSWLGTLSAYPEDSIRKSFELLKKKSDTFVDVGKVIELLDDKEDAWNMALTSARNGGRYPITARLAKTLNSLGGMQRLMDASIDDLVWIKKDFDGVYPLVPENIDVDGLRCIGLKAEIIGSERQVICING